MGVQPWHTVDRFASRPLYEGGDGAVHQLRRGKHNRVVNSGVAWQTVCTPSSLVKKRSIYRDRRRHTSLLLSVVLHDSSLETSVVHLRYGSRAYCTHKHVATCTWVHALVCTSLEYNVDQYRQARRSQRERPNHNADTKLRKLQFLPRNVRALSCIVSLLQQPRREYAR